jgi:hypothetical protein
VALTVDLAAEWLGRLRPELDGYARLALDNIGREFPSHVAALMTGPGDFPARPRDRTPVFYGSFDWHSCVEMHWVLVRMLKVAADAVPAGQIRAALDGQFTAAGLRAEAEFMRTRGNSERPYGWGWALALADELASWPGDQDAPRWAAAMEPLAAVLTDNFLRWLPKETYPVRSGLHANSSFGLSLALPFARRQAAPAARRPAHPGLHGGLAAARRSLPAPRGGRRLHGHPLARGVRRPAVQLSSVQLSSVQLSSGPTSRARTPTNRARSASSSSVLTATQVAPAAA